MGVEAFKELEELIARKTTACLRGKIFTFEADNRYFDGELIRTSRDLKTYLDYNLVAYSEENRSLKAELDKLSGVQKQLEDANTKVGEQAKKIAEIPTLKIDLQALQERLDATEAEKKKNEEVIEQLKRDKASLTEMVAIGAVSDFERCLNMVVILEPSLDTEPLRAEYKVENGRIVYKGHVIYDPTLVSSPA